MPKQPGKYPDQLRERAVRMVLDHGHEYGSQWEAICSVVGEARHVPMAARSPRRFGCGSARPNVTPAGDLVPRPRSWPS